MGENFMRVGDVPTRFIERKTMKNVLFSTVALFAIAIASPALAQESEGDNRWDFTAQETIRPAWLADIGVTRAPGAAAETLLLACRPDDDMTICIDVWNSEAINLEDDSATPYDERTFIRDAVHETDLEVEASFHRAIPGFTLRIKGALFELAGPEVYEARAALDHSLGDACTGTGSVEFLRGAFEFDIYKISATCGHQFGQWNLSGDVGLAYNTLFEETVMPIELRLSRGERIIGTVGIGAYARGIGQDTEDMSGDMRGFVRVTLRSH